MHPTPQRARVSANLVFFTYGLLIGSYLPYFPFLKDRFGIGEGVFSLGLLAAAAGALISMPLAPLVMRWIGSRKAILYSSLIYLTVVAFAISATTFVVFGVAIKGPWATLQRDLQVAAICMNMMDALLSAVLTSSPVTTAFQ